MTKKNDEKLNALIFIDTNIFLDFYRIRNSNVSMKYLEQIEEHIDSIITSSQVEMEYKKNRQSVILDSISELKKVGNIGVSVPAILSDAKAVEMIKKSKKNISRQHKQLKERIEKILKNPNYNDPVFKSLQKLFKNKSKINLHRENQSRFEIRELAQKRFTLGYPPRKKSDNSIGDALNWEWIIDCAKKSGKDIIIVTRDSDFGCNYDNESHLNDWLKQEFKERISQKRKIILTERLTTAFKLVEIPVTEEMIKEENIVIKLSKNNFDYQNFQTAIHGLQNSFNDFGFNESIRQVHDLTKGFYNNNFLTDINHSDESE